MIEYVKQTPETVNMPTPAEHTVDRIAQAYLSYGMEGVCAAFGDIDPIQVRAAAENIARNDPSKPENDQEIKTLVDQANTAIDNSGGIENYLDAMLERREQRAAAAELQPTTAQPDSIPRSAEFSTTESHEASRQQPPTPLGRSAVARFFRGER